jgi:hypothetical protein
MSVQDRPAAGTSARHAGADAHRKRSRALVRLPVLALAAVLCLLGALGLIHLGHAPASSGRAGAVRSGHGQVYRVPVGPFGIGWPTGAEPVPRHPANDALAALALVLACVAWRGRPRPDPQRWIRGAAGEAATAALLGLLGRRWVVRHDLGVPGSRANVDHVVIGPTGVWVIDSKAYRAPLRAGWRSVPGPDRPVDTAAVAWEAEVVADRLGVAACALVVVHGRGLPNRGRRVGGVRVLPAAGALSYLRRGRWSWWCRPGRSRHLGPAAVVRLAGILEATFAPAAWQDALPGRHAGRGRERLR